MKYHLLTIAPFLLTALNPVILLAQSSNPQQAVVAQDLYDKATKEMDAGAYESACKKLEEVTRLAPEGIGARLTLGECYEKLGRLASSWAQYSAAQTMATMAGRADRAKAAAAKVAQLRPELATMTINVPYGLRNADGLIVKRDGSPIGEVVWGTAVPMDQGFYIVAASATGLVTWTKKVEVKNGDRIIVDVRLGQEVGEPNPPSTAATPLPTLLPRAQQSPPSRFDITIKPPQDAAEVEPDSAWQRPMGITALAIGGVSATFATILGGLAISSKDLSNMGHCGADDRCDAIGIARRDEALNFGNASTAAFIAAGVSWVGGVVLLATAPAPRERARSVAHNSRWQARVEAGPNGLQLRGKW